MYCFHKCPAICCLLFKRRCLTLCALDMTLHCGDGLDSFIWLHTYRCNCILERMPDVYMCMRLTNELPELPAGVRTWMAIDQVNISRRGWCRSELTRAELYDRDDVAYSWWTIVMAGKSATYTLTRFTACVRRRVLSLSRWLSVSLRIYICVICIWTILCLLTASQSVSQFTYCASVGLIPSLAKKSKSGIRFDSVPRIWLVRLSAV